MLKTCKNDEKYAFISIEDILTELISNDCQMKEQLLDIYHSDQFDENGNYRFKKNSKLYRYLKRSPYIIDGDTYISLERLSNAFMIANYEHNHEIEKRLKKYYRYYMDVLIAKEGKEVITNMILNDQKVIQYITRFESMEEFIKYEQEKKKGKMEDKMIPFPNEKAVPKSFVKIG